MIPGIKDASRTAGGYYGMNLSSSVHGDYRSMTGFCQYTNCRQIRLTRHFSHANCTIHFMHITLHGSSVCMRASFHLHAIHDERLIVRSLSVSSCLSFSCFSPLFTSSLPHYLHSDLHSFFHVNSAKGSNRCALAQYGVLPFGDIPSSHMSEMSRDIRKQRGHARSRESDVGKSTSQHNHKTS